MKKKFTFLGAALVLLAFLAIPLGMRGENVTLQYTGTTTINMTGNNDAATVGLDAQHWSVVGDKGSNSNFPGFNKDGTIRLYYHADGSNTITVTNSDDYTISSIAVTYKQNYSNGTITVDDNEVTGTGSATQKTYEINASSFVIGNGNTSNIQVRIEKVVITYTTGSSPVVATPIITPEGGIFLESQEVSITCATEDATIYYTTNGNTPTTSSNVYSAPFTITETTTVKAIAAKANYDNSEIVSATFTKSTPKTVAEAITLIDSLNGGTSDDVFVTGIISQIDAYHPDYHSITYWISDDGTTTNQLEVYSGKGLNGADFNSIGDLVAQSEVIVKGKLKKYNDTYEFTQTSQIVSLTPPAITVATPTFSPAAGTYTEIQTVTITCENQGADIFYTTDGSTPTDESTPYSSPITVSETTTIKAIAYYEDYPSAVASAEYVIHLPYSGPAYARIDNVSYLTDGVKVVLAARCDTVPTHYYAMTNDVTGKPAGVSFISTTSDDFEVLPADILNSESDYCWTVGVTENGYTFTNASNQTIGWTSSTNFANGGDNTVWTVTNGTSGENAMVPNYTAFNIKNHSTLTANTVRVFALNNLHNFGPYALSNNDNADYNLSIDIFVQGAEPAATPYINANNVVIAYNATSGSIEYEIMNPVTGTALTASTDDSWISDLTVGETAVTFTTTANEGEEDRTATITLTYGQITKDITVTQGHYVIDYAELPFVWEGGSSADFNALTGTTLSGNGSDYASGHAPFLIKFDSDNDYIMVKTDSQPGKVTIGVKMIGGGNTSTITVQGSADGENFNDIEALTISGASGDTLFLETINAFDAADRYVKMVFTKGSNVGVGPITIAKPSTDPVINVTPATVELDADQNVISNETAFNIIYQNIEVTNYGSFGIQYYDAAGEIQLDEETWLTLGVVGTNAEGYKVAGYVSANDGEARSAYFKVYCGDVNSNLVTINQAAAPQQYALTVEPFENLELITFVNDEMLMEGDSTIYVMEGDTIMLSVVALEGYIMETLVINDENHVNDIADDFTYTFVMPAENVTISATAVEDVAPEGGNYVRITSLDQLTDGCKVIIAARYDEDHTNGYYAMPGVTSGKPTGVAFTSETSGNDEILPVTITSSEDTYYWTVNITENGYTFTNANNQLIGYSSSTNFATGGNNIEWTITCDTAATTAMVAEYTGFVIRNKNTSTRAFAFNGSAFGAYATTNMSANYNFFLDFFVQVEAPQTDTQTIALVENYNTISTYLNVTLDDIKAALVAAFGETTTGIQITAPNGTNSTYVLRNGTYMWRGTITEWDATQLLIISAPGIPANPFVLEGEPLGSVDINIVEGYNNITFTCTTEMPFTTAFASFPAINGDQVIAPNGDIATFRNTWRGALSTQNLVPGTGYTYYSNQAEPRTLNFPASAK